VPVPVEPQPVDPSTLRVGDRVRVEFERDDLVVEGVITSVQDSGATIGKYGWVKRLDRRQWFLLDRPEPVDPRREAVTRAVAELRARDVMLTDERRR
jgi:hypothetical protein